MTITITNNTPNKTVEINKEIDGETGIKLLCINESRYLGKGYTYLHISTGYVHQKLGAQNNIKTTSVNIKRTPKNTSYTCGKSMKTQTGNKNYTLG